MVQHLFSKKLYGFNRGGFNNEVIIPGNKRPKIIECGPSANQGQFTGFLRDNIEKRTDLKIFLVFCNNMSDISTAD